jgi:hypothetical protein
MTDVFISYARADRARVRYIAHALAAEGFAVWWDPEIKPGAKWNEAIRKALEAAGAVVTCWSRTSAKSKWVLAETTFADGQKKLVSTIIQRCDPPIPYNMTHSADLTAWKGAADDPEWVAVLGQVKSLVEAKRRRFAAAPPPAGEANAAMRGMVGGLGAGEAFSPADAAYRLDPQRGRAGGSKAARWITAAAVTALLTAGVLAGPELVDRFRSPPAPVPAPPASTPIAPQETAALSPDAMPATEVAPLEPVTAPEPPTLPAAPPPAVKPPAAKPPPATTRPRPAEPAPVPASTPQADPRQPWIDLDTCAQSLVARCNSASASRGFTNDMKISTQEASFLRKLGVETSTINADVAARCQRQLAQPTALTDSAGAPTPLGQACGAKTPGQGLSTGEKVAIGAGIAILGGILASQGGGGRDQPPPTTTRPPPQQPPPPPPTRTSPPPPPPPPTPTQDYGMVRPPPPPSQPR